MVDSINTLSEKSESAAQYNFETRAMVTEWLQTLKELALKSDHQVKETKDLAFKPERHEYSSNTRLKAMEKAIIDQGTELKERKLIISGVKEEKGENVRQVAVRTIRKALSVAKTAQEDKDYAGATFTTKNLHNQKLPGRR